MSHQRDDPWRDRGDEPVRRRVRPGLLVLLGVAVVVALLAAAFGPSPTAAVSGRVTEHGVPVTAGTVTMTAADGTTVSAGIRADGSYSLTGLPPGTARVEVEVAAPARRAARGAKAGAAGPAPPISKQPVGHRDPTPSRRTVVLSPGSNTHHVELE